MAAGMKALHDSAAKALCTLAQGDPLIAAALRSINAEHKHKPVDE